jgi:hypothetical protein
VALGDGLTEGSATAPGLFAGVGDPGDDDPELLFEPGLLGLLGAWAPVWCRTS